MSGKDKDKRIDTSQSDDGFNMVTDADERQRKLISGDPMKFLHTNGS